jgi:hypothetical protein
MDMPEHNEPDWIIWRKAVAAHMWQLKQVSLDNSIHGGDYARTLWLDAVDAREAAIDILQEDGYEVANDA